MYRNINTWVSLLESFLPEKIQTRFCTYILGVGKYGSNIASRAELGRFPVAVSALLNSVKYWLNLLQNPFEKKATV